jgi:hypothetical protein
MAFPSRFAIATFFFRNKGFVENPMESCQKI